MIRHFFSSTFSPAPRGFTLLIALIFTSVILSVGLSLMDVAYKQQILASTARQSEYAFYAADSAMECALEQDQVADTFDYSASQTSGSFSCEGKTINYSWPAAVGNARTTYPLATFSIPCPTGGSGRIANVTIYKTPIGSTPPTTRIYSTGFNDCNVNDAQRVERGLESQY